MSNVRMRIQTAVLAFILLPAAAGVLVVHASQTCERYVRTYVAKPVRNRVSTATAAAWARWRIAHPNWKPNPKVSRPKYVMTREEAMAKMDFACAVPTLPSTTTLLFTPADFEGPPPIVDIPPMEATQIDLPNALPPEVSEIPPETPSDSWPPFVPFIPPILGSAPGGSSAVLTVVPPPLPVTGPVPEPPSLILAASGIAALGVLTVTKRRRPSTG